LRDFSRVTQGVLLVRAYPGFDEASLARLWAHECSRVFGDRLVDREDRRWFLHQMKATISDEIGMAPHTLFERIAHPDPENMAEEEIEIEEDGIGVDQMRALIFADFLDPTAPNRIYKEADDLDSMTEVLEAELEEYNSDNSGKQMPLVLFRFAAEHVARIARVLSMPGGNCLLVGVGGSGRQSLTKLATKIAGCNVEQIEISKTYGMSAWREDMMRIVQSAGGGQTPVVFLFSDTQIKDERFVEDISNLLNSGEIPNLYPPEDKIELLDYVRTQHGKRNRELADMNPAAVYNWFVARTRTQLHIVLAFSPIGDAFRERLRKFPSLINCCTIDWFTAWPDDALNAVAVKFLGGIELGDSFKDICDRDEVAATPLRGRPVRFRFPQGRQLVGVLAVSLLL
jgi:dynein heavy chain